MIELIRIIKGFYAKGHSTIKICEILQVSAFHPNPEYLETLCFDVDLEVNHDMLIKACEAMPKWESALALFILGQNVL